MKPHPSAVLVRSIQAFMGAIRWRDRIGLWPPPDRLDDCDDEFSDWKETYSALYDRPMLITDDARLNAPPTARHRSWPC